MNHQQLEGIKHEWVLRRNFLAASEIVPLYLHTKEAMRSLSQCMQPLDIRNSEITVPLIQPHLTHSAEWEGADIMSHDNTPCCYHLEAPS